MANGECRTEELWLRYFICKISQVAFTLREKSTLTINVCLRVLDSEDKRNSRFFSIKRRSSFPRINGLLSTTLHRQSQEI